MTLLKSLSLRVICDLGEFPLGRLEVGVVLDVGLDLGVGRQPHVLRSISNNRGLGLGHVGTAVGQLVKALVVLHVEDHVANLAPEAVLVPDLLKALELLHRVNSLPALGAKLGHLEGLISLDHKSQLTLLISLGPRVSVESQLLPIVSCSGPQSSQASPHHILLANSGLRL